MLPPTLILAAEVEIDWTTFAAQIVNFLVLAWLLKRFLYGPITRAMQNREEKIASRLEEADEKRREAERKAERHQSQLDELEREKGRLLEEARERAEERRGELLHEARQEVDRQRREWQNALDRERRTLLETVRAEVGRQVTAVSRRVLRELADVDLQERIVATFLARLEDEGSSERESLARRLANHGVAVRTRHELPQETQQRVEGVLRQALPDETPVTFETVDDLVCGIRLAGGGNVVEWSVDEYLESVEREFDRAIGAAEPVTTPEDDSESAQPDSAGGSEVERSETSESPSEAATE